MKLFNMASPKFGEQGGTNMQSMEVANVYIRLYKKKMMASMSTREFLTYPWSPSQCAVFVGVFCTGKLWGG
jgi:hypothetical protein